MFLALTQEIQDACDKDELPCRVLLDFQKAFDLVNQYMVRSKLK